MKVLEAMSASLTNYEVYEHLTSQKARYAQQNRRGPPNLETVVREVIQSLRIHPAPLSQNPITYSPESIAQLVQSVRPYNLTKGEIIMLLNHRPETVAQLMAVVDEMEDRFTTDEQVNIIRAVTNVLGRFPTAGKPTGRQTNGGAIRAD